MTSYAKIKITGTLTVKTGLHIGTGAGFAAIGATDSPVLRDSLTKLPLIPGSSLKGKMRSLLARADGFESGRLAKAPNSDSARVRRVFGDTNDFYAGRLVFRDCVLANAPSLQQRGARTLTEVKFENTINRVTSVANPRQIERVIAGSEFRFDLIYEIARSRNGELPSEEEIREDFATIAEGLRLLELDYLGGHGTRGYGRISFGNTLHAEVGFGHVGSELLEGLNNELQAL
ncbi:MAG: type III-A CRISPR-associated RAMP protein Csm3 [Bifidobacteriaceae bacterium]|jgi:CRISPR-associated protein Csm3|nr:type III-A CRISPR-associated RAMP protein Csm3 [Bifidobacteriaceae bacterium]